MMYPESFTPESDLESGPTQAMVRPPPMPDHGLAPAESFQLAVGTVINQRYEILSLLGVGGMGIVYQARDRTLGIDVALKLLRPEVANDQEFLERFRKELLVARRVTHRNVVRIHDIGEDNGRYYMTMDLVKGRSLQELLKEKGTLELAEAADIVHQIAEALAEAHRQGVVHRDLKPANILLDTDGRAVMTDFGIARSLQTPGFTQTGTVLGTPHYLSPEQARGEQVDGRSDLYTLGILFVEMLSGKLPFPQGTLLEVLAHRMTGKTQSLEELGVQTPPAFNAVVDRCLARDPTQRYQNAEELIADLDDLRRPGRRRRRRALAKAAVAIAALAVVGFGGVSLWRWLESRPVPAAVAPPAAPAPAEPAEPLHSVAVLPFPEESGSEDLAWASIGIAEMLASALAESESLRVVTSVRVVQMLEDLGFRSARLRDDEIRQLAETFQVNRLVTGRLRSAGEQIQIEVSLVEADQPGSPSRVIGSRTGSAEELFDLVEQLGASLRESLEVPPIASAQTAATPSAAAMKAYAESVQQLALGDSTGAAQALERAVSEDAGFTPAWMSLAGVYRDLGRHDEAVRAATAAVRSIGEQSGRVGFEARAQEALLRGDPEAAQSFLQQLVERYPNDAEARIALAEAYGLQGRFGEAVEALKRAVRVDPSEPHAWYLLGRYSIGAGDNRRAVDDYLVRALVQQKKRKDDHGQAEVYNALGVGFQRLGELDQAIENYQTAAEISRRIDDRRGLARTLYNLGAIYLARGDPDAAEPHIRTALEIHTELRNQEGIGELNTAYGALEEVRGRYSEALEYYRRASQVRSDLGDERAVAESYNNVGFAYYLLGEYDNAVLYLERSLALVEKNDDRNGSILPLQSIGLCQLAQGRWPKAQQSFLRALEVSRETGQKHTAAVSQANLGLVAQYQGRYSAAFSSYREALEVLEELGDRRGQVEFTLHECAARLELGDLAGTAALLDRIESLQADVGNQEQRAEYLGLRGVWQLESGEIEVAEKTLAESRSAAQASNSATALVTARIRAGLHALKADRPKRALELLRPAAEEAERLGHAVFRLRAGEALAAAELADGSPARAEEAVRGALSVSLETGAYARTFRLRHLLASALGESGARDAADRELRDARVQLERIQQQLEPELLLAFDRSPSVEALSAETP